MKFLYSFAVVLALSLVSAPVWAATQPAATTLPPTATQSTALPPDTTFHMVGHGANSRTLQRETYEQGPNGKVIAHIHKYEELSSGLYYQDSNGNSVEAQELIEPFASGAVARHGRHQALFSNNLNSQGSIDIRAPRGERLQINVLGLALYDSSSDSTLMIGQIQDSQGELISSNQVLYPNAFNGVNADVRYTYRRGGFEQDIIVRERPATTPQAANMNLETTYIEVITEFVTPAQEKIQERSNRTGALPDEDVSWGSMFLGHGKAFELGESTGFPHVPVSKRYITTPDGRKLLLELLPWKSVQATLSKLPRQASIQRKNPVMLAKNLAFPKTPGAKSAEHPMKLASNLPSNKGYVLDYYLLDNLETNTFTFQSDATYLIHGSFNVDAACYFEGGTVIKYATDVGSELQLWGPAYCKSSEFRPIVMTSQNDNSVGEVISNGTSLFVANEFSMNAGSSDVAMEHLRCSYTDVGVHPTCSTFRLKDAQFFNCNRPICPESVDCQLNNILIVNATNAFWGGAYSVEASHFTVDGCQQLTDGWGDSSSVNIAFTNSLLANIYGFGAATVTTNYTALLASDTGIFQTAGGGSYYLATNSPYQGVGTTNIDPEWLADIATKTTYPPVIYYTPAIYFSSNLTLNPQAPRDTNSSPDIGYHYDCLDYIFGPTYITNSTITVNPDTAIGIFGSNVWTYGFAAANNGSFVCHGVPNNLNHIAVYNTVQEQAAPGWKEISFGSVTHFNGTNSLIDCQFTDWSILAMDGLHADLGTINSPISFKNCQFHGGSIQAWESSINLTNCLLERVYFLTGPSDSTVSSFRNNTFWNGTFEFDPEFNASSIFYDNLFDGTSIPDGLGGAGVTYIGDHNAFVTNCDTLDPLQTGDIILSASPDYQTSWLGNYYLPPDSPLVNAGSLTADKVGLYQFTTQTNQAKEAFSYVDTGYHYVAIDPATGQPYSTYTNGIPDYIADSDGNGLPDYWEIANIGHIGVDPNADPDGDGYSNYQEYLNGTNPNVVDQPTQVIVTMPGQGTIVP